MFNELLDLLKRNKSPKHFVLMDDYFENDLKTKCQCGCGLKINDFKDGTPFNIK
ncbi:hypothetical protein [Wocania ichthyoenteri]|uniref:hypothetical protein n=1 Tax=Wocania ichthyoenteri TaxID=1230531 RepID=UPI0012E03315|nr:hypothetical protein [Wocania ichthyoenteri]